MDITEKINKYLNEEIYQDILDKGIFKNILHPKREVGRTDDIIKILQKKGYNKNQIKKAKNKVKKEAEKLAQEMNIDYEYNDKNFHGLMLGINSPIEEFGEKLKERINKL